MTIWVDADACPQVIKQILFKAAQKRGITTYFVANHYFQVPPSPFIKHVQVQQGFDVADHYISQAVQVGDLLITGDIPLADEVISKDASVITPRGEKLTKNNIKGRLNMRDFSETLRASGIQSSGPAALNQKDRQQFANALDQYYQQQQP